MSAPIVKRFTQPNFAWTRVSMILLWFNVLTPEYLRATVTR